VKWITNIRDAHHDKNGYFGNCLCSDCSRKMYGHPEAYCCECGVTLCYKCAFQTERKNTVVAWLCIPCFLIENTDYGKLKKACKIFKGALYDSFGSHIREAITTIKNWRKK
jgi:hypothetical protein